MPNRIIKESICYSEDIDKLSSFEETVFYRLLVRVDDYGRIDARPNFLKSMLFVTKQGITEKNVQDAVFKLASIGLVRLYEVDGKSFLLFPKWNLHQRVRNSKEKYPAPQNESDFKSSPQVAASRGELPPESNPNPNPNPNPNISGRVNAPHKKFIKPTLEEVTDYCTQRKNRVDAQKFINYYEANGWKVGRNQMKDWKAAVRNWEGYEKAPKTQKMESSYDIDEFERYLNSSPVE